MIVSLRIHQVAVQAASFLDGVVALAQRRLRPLFSLGGQFIQQLSHGPRQTIAEIPLVGALQHRIDQLTDLGASGRVQVLYLSQVLTSQWAVHPHKKPFQGYSQNPGDSRQPLLRNASLVEPLADRLYGHSNRISQLSITQAARFQRFFQASVHPIGITNHKLNIVKTDYP